MDTSIGQPKSALWIPGWYELDQSLEVGQRKKFWFYQHPPTDLAGGKHADLVFYNQLGSPAASCQVRVATIAAMRHPTLGELRRIDADGLDYIFYRTHGPEVIVNADEDPGGVYDEPLQIINWAVEVVLDGVSDALTCDQGIDHEQMIEKIHPGNSVASTPHTLTSRPAH